MATNEEITRHDDADPDDDTWVGGPPPAVPIAVVEYDPAWPAVFEELAGRIRDALGDRVLGLEHVGSTSVPGLAAKPVIDIDLTVVDSSDEAAYVPATRGDGVRPADPGAEVARAPVSVRWTIRGRTCTSGVPDSPEAIRHRMFRDWLRTHPDDLALLRRRPSGRRPQSRTAAGEDGDGVQPAQAAGDPRHPRSHVPRPRHALTAIVLGLDRINVRDCGCRDRTDDRYPWVMFADLVEDLMGLDDAAVTERFRELELRRRRDEAELLALVAVARSTGRVRRGWSSQQ